MLIMALDSSSTSASVSILQAEMSEIKDKFSNVKILGESYINTKLTHSQTLVPMIADLLKNVKIKPEDINLFAVSAGPGSFTGIRIGISVVKGMAMALDKKCIVVSTLQAIAYNLIGFNGIVCAVMDARREQVYNAVFEISDSKINRIIDDRAISIQELGEKLKHFDKKIYLVGDGANLCYNTLGGRNSNVYLAPEQLKYQRASSVAFAGLDLYNDVGVVSASEIIPVYLRPSQAERELKGQG